MGPQRFYLLALILPELSLGPQGSGGRSSARCPPGHPQVRSWRAFRTPSSLRLVHLPLRHRPPCAHKGEDADDLWQTQGAVFVEPWALHLLEQPCTLYKIIRSPVSEDSRRLGGEVRARNENERARKLLLPKGWF